MSPAAVDATSRSGLDAIRAKAENGREDAPHEEYQYLDLIRDILDHGEHRPDRYVHSKSCVIWPRLLRTRLQDRDGHLLHFRPGPAQVLSFRRRNREAHPPASHHQTSLPARRHCRAPLVHRRNDYFTAAHRSRHQDLGRQRIARLPRLGWTLTSRGRRLGSRVRLPMATLWR